MNGTLRFAFLLLSLLACTHAPPGVPTSTAPAAASTPTPPPLPCRPHGLLPDTLLTPGQVLVLGEIHGTRQSQRAVDDVLCQILLRGRQAVLVLEIPLEETARLEAFLSGGSVQALLAGDFWRREYQDGRGSQAMLGLLERVRTMRGAGLPVSVVLMDSVMPGADRDAFMAAQVVAAHERSPQALTVVLVGNIHARTRLSLPRSMAWQVRKAGLPLTSVLLEYGEGSAWICGRGDAGSCGEQHLGSRQDGPPRAFEPEAQPATAGFEGRLYLGPMEASPPAVSEGRPVSAPSPVPSPALAPPEASPASPPRT